MRFLLFNIVVGAALLYLYKGGEMDLSLFAGPSATPVQIEAANSPSAPDPTPGHARDVIADPPAPAPQPAPPPREPKDSGVQPQPEAAEQTVAHTEVLPAIEETVAVARRTPKKPTDLHLPAVEDPAILRRRAEVLGTATEPPRQPPLALKQGTTLMSISDRRRSLDALAEEMEMLFLDQTGG